MRDHLPVWVDHNRLAPGVKLTGRVELSKLDDWPAGEASVQLSIEVVQAASGRMALQGELQGWTMLTCQRCLEPMQVDWQGSFELEVVSSSKHAQHVDTALDIYVLDGGRVLLHELAREESLLALPMTTRHPEGECSPPGQTVLD